MLDPFAIQFIQCWMLDVMFEPAQNISSNIQHVLHVCAYIQHPTFYDRMLFRTLIERFGCIFLLFVLVLIILAFKMASASSESEYNDTEFQAFVGNKNFKKEKTKKTKLI